MRILTTLLIALTLLAGCAREDAAEVPDRGDHAYVIAGASAGSGSSKPLVSSNPEPGAGETTVIFRPDDRLYRIAEEHGVTLDWLIRRNDLVDHPPRAGDDLIVPRR
ncbi:MAG: LysM peptidoglycan-binding domain-containing protein [Planctomycetota bacterium]|jgi:LysM repeat protein|nr:LysM peptidoglycan-binding domain-containing protein [Planctomycetota bacterium]